jgi:hypothetical protein
LRLIDGASRNALDRDEVLGGYLGEIPGLRRTRRRRLRFQPDFVDVDALARRWRFRYALLPNRRRESYRRRDGCGSLINGVS